MRIHFFTAPFYFAFIWFRALVAASLPFLEDGILALSEQIHAYVEKNNDGQSLPRMGKVASGASRIGF